MNRQTISAESAELMICEIINDVSEEQLAAMLTIVLRQKVKVAKRDRLQITDEPWDIKEFK